MLFDADEGGVEHCSGDQFSVAIDAMTDWVADVLQPLRPSRPLIMEYIAPRTLDEAYRALEADESRCLAGGQSLVAMMNLGLLAPSRLVSLRRIDALRGIAVQPDGGVRIGAMTTHAELASLATSAAGPALLAKAARVVAYPAVRAWGTIGGSVAHADPAADYPVALVAADAMIEIGSAAGTRRRRGAAISSADFSRPRSRAERS